MSSRLLPALCLLLSCAAALLPGSEQRHSIVIDGKERFFDVYQPHSLPARTTVPLVVVFHGGGGSPEAAAKEGGWKQQAEHARFILALPAGSAADPDQPSSFVNNQRSWNDGSMRPSVGAAERGEADVLFVAAMLRHIERRYPIDSHRIYATGFSNGASMCLRLGRELSHRFAAIAPVAGADYRAEAVPEPRRAVPLCYLTGDSDPLNPLAGGDIHIGRKSFGSKPPVMSIIRDWRKQHGCAPLGETIRNDERVLIRSWDDELGGAKVTLVIVKDHGHHWPGGPRMLPDWIAGPYNAQAVAVTPLIWRFFRRHRLPTGIGLPYDG